jgi:hypothetical protein
MKASRALLVAGLCAMALGAVSESALAGGRGGHGGGHGGGPNVSVGAWGPGWSGGGAWRGGAWGPGWRGGVWVGGPGWWGPGWWGPSVWGPGWWGPGVWGPGVWSTGVWGPGVWAPGVAVVQSEPRVFVERDAPAAQPQQWWYWCQSAQGYYPYVSTCSEGWRRVEPQVPQGQQ